MDNEYIVRAKELLKDRKVQIGLAVLVLLVIGSVAYMNGRKDSQTWTEPTPTPVPTIDPTLTNTAGWVTYENKKYNYTLLYPPAGEILDVIEADTTSESTDKANFDKVAIAFKESGLFGISAILPGKTTDLGLFSIPQVTKKSSLLAAATTARTSSTLGADATFTKEATPLNSFKFLNMDAYEFNLKNTYTETGETYAARYIIFDKNGVKFILEVPEGNSASGYVLNSLKFK